jgi:hypothetical protein
MTKLFIISMLSWLLQPTATLGQQTAPPADMYAHHDATLLPNHNLTPGAIALTDKKVICTKKWGKDARAVTAAMKAEVYAEYGQKPRAGICAIVSHKNKAGELVKNTGCEIDHLVSRELGGADDVKNLWAQPYLTPDQPGAYQKDKLENRLHVLVCTDKMVLSDAQACIMNDWATCYSQVFGATR